MSYRVYAYAKAGAVIGGLIGLSYGVFDGLQDTQSWFTETLESIFDNEMLSNPYLVATGDTLLGIVSGSGISVLIWTTKLYLKSKKK